MSRLPGAEGLVLVLCASAALALLAGAPVWRRALSAGAAVALLALPFFVDASAVVRGIIALSASMTLFRVIDLLRQPAPPGAALRVWHVLGIVDTRRVARVAPRLRGGSVVRAAAFAALSLAALWLAARWTGAPSVSAAGVARWLAGVVFCYCSFEVLAALVEVAYGALGLRLPMLHDAPIRARTLEEFWGRRWNRTVSGWLRATLFLPLARRGALRLGLAAAFAASALLHAYVAWAALDLRAALVVGAFFAAQLPLLLLERRLGVPRWPELAARAWTLGLLLLTSPLFVLPTLAAVDPLFAR